jgi:hypothetical protein
MMSSDDPENWSQAKLAMKRQLDEAGIPEDTVWELVNSRNDYPEAVPIIVDWLEHLDERVPPDEDRRAWRAGLLRNLITKHAKGNRAAAAILFHQFEIEPPLTNLEVEAACLALAEVADRSDFPRIAELLRSKRDLPGSSALVLWLGRIKTAEAKELAVSLLAHPGTRIQAMRALVRQKATGVREAVAVYLDNEHAVFRKEARKTLDKLPED